MKQRACLSKTSIFVRSLLGRGARTAPALALVLATVILALSSPGSVPVIAAASEANETCYDCHSDDTLDKSVNGRTISLYVDDAVFSRSVHGDMDCVDCHQDIDVDDLPHDEELEAVNCGMCHDDAQLEFDSSIHGQALKRKAPYAPTCGDCHGKHDILPPSDPASKAFRMKIPYLCGECHREGAPVARAYDIHEHNIIENYSLSIHGEGLFRKGLTVSATCIDCHRSHRILPHSDPNSSIAPRNIAGTCMQCHSRIEEVHIKTIKGELWEEAPGAIPNCNDCHLPHKVRKDDMALVLSDRQCMSCHEQPDVHKVVDGVTVNLSVDGEELELSTHKNIPCIKCHSDVDPRRKRPCETAHLVDCASCHAKISEEYAISGHGVAHENGVEQAPYCTDCHGDHGVKPREDEDSPIYRASIPTLCGECHKTGGKAPEATELLEQDAFADYSMSVHGKGLTEKGLLPSAVCTDCHTSHMVLKYSDPRSSVSRANIPATCASCHRGIYKDFIKSVHYSTNEKEEEKLPVCSDCHSAHTIQETGQDQFMTEITTQCGSCHSHLSETYLETMHGKAYRLGYLDAARCSDCHGAHMILPANDPLSSVGLHNIVGTCQKCHEDANARFTGYLTHATHHDSEKYPILYYTYWAMTLLLLGVFGFFGVHTLLWLPRSFRAMRERARDKKHAKGDSTRYYIRRFTRQQRITHLFVIISFLSLALTGLMLKFSSMAWAGYVANLLGGVKGAGTIHRFAAVITFGYFAFHLISLYRYKRRRKLSLFRLVFSRGSLMFNKKDIQDFWGTLKWFFNKGPRPQYGRWTYWEKFDYLAVFWGVAVIGASGLMLWFPEFFTRFLPGWLINVATIIHSDEALLAIGFIFTVHFFNTHLRPEAFPMDTVIFTGITPLEHYKVERPEAYAELKRTGELGKRVTTRPITGGWDIVIRVFGYAALTVGVILIILILYSVLFGYK